MFRTPLHNAPSDIDILNYALTLEHLEAAFYREGLSRFGFDDFVNGNFTNNFTTDPSGGLALGVYDLFRSIREHEQTHVTILVQVIRSLGGTPVGPCRYNFGYSNVDQFLGVAQALENSSTQSFERDFAISGGVRYPQDHGGDPCDRRTLHRRLLSGRSLPD